MTLTYSTQHYRQHNSILFDYLVVYTYHYQDGNSYQIAIFEDGIDGEEDRMIGQRIRVDNQEQVDKYLQIAETHPIQLYELCVSQEIKWHIQQITQLRLDIINYGTNQ